MPHDPNDEAVTLASLSDMAIHTAKDGPGITMELLADLKRRIRLGFPDADSIDVQRNKPTDPIWVEIRGPGPRLIQRTIRVHEYRSPVEETP